MRSSILALVVVAMLVAFPAVTHANNLIQNQGAEWFHASGWTTTQGQLTQFQYGGTPGWPTKDTEGPPIRGQYFFAGGNFALTVTYQDIDLTSFTQVIDQKAGESTLSAWIGGYETQQDRAELKCEFRDKDGVIIGRMMIGPVFAGERASTTKFLFKTATMRIPAYTRSARVTMTMTRADGIENSGYVDEIGLSVRTTGSIITDHVSTTFAGYGVQNVIDSTDNSPAASLASPRDIVKVTAGPFAGNFFFTESLAHTIRLLEWNGVVTHFAGKVLTPGNVDGDPSVHLFNDPRGIDYDSNGILFVCDRGNKKIRGINDARLAITWVTIADEPSGIVINRNTGHMFVSASNRIWKITGFGAATPLAGSNVACAHADAETGANARFCNPVGVTLDPSGNVVVADTGNNRIRLVHAFSGFTLTLSGDGTAAKVDGQQANAQWNAPVSVGVDAYNRMYVVSRGDSSVRLMANGEVVTLAGGSASFGDGNVMETFFNTPEGMFFDDGTMYICDYANFRIRLFSTRVVNKVAGEASPGYGDYPKAMYKQPFDIATARDQLMIVDTLNHRIAYGWYYGSTFGSFNYLGSSGGYVDGSAQAAKFEYPVAVAYENDVLYIADWRSMRRFGNGIVRTISQMYGVQKMCVKDGYVRFTIDNRVMFIHGDQFPAQNGNPMAGTTEAGHVDGQGVEARFNKPKGIAVDRDANNFVADSENYLIRKVTNSFTVFTVAGIVGQAGSRDGPVFYARFTPYAIAVTLDGSLVVTGFDNRVRLISEGFVSTIAGNGESGAAGGDAKTTATFNRPRGVAILNQVIHIADTQNNMIRKIDPVTITESVGAAQCSATGYTQVDGVNAIISDTNGHFSPDVPYANNENCDYTITCPVGKAVQLITLEGQVDPDADHIGFYDTRSKTASSINKLRYGVANPVKPFYQAHGLYLSYLPPGVQSTMLEEVTVKFITNGQYTATGWTLKYECVNQPATGSQVGDSVCFSNDNAMFECNFHGEAVWAHCNNFRFHLLAEVPEPSADFSVVVALGVQVTGTNTDRCIVTRHATNTHLPVVTCNGFVVDSNSPSNAFGALSVVFSSPTILSINDDQGNKVLINFFPNSVAYVYSASAACQGNVQGLGGNFDFDPSNDFVSRSGFVHTPQTAPQSQIYNDFVKSWLVTLSAESVFRSDLPFTAPDLSFTPAFGTTSTVDNCPNFCNGQYECCLVDEFQGEDAANDVLAALAWRTFVLSPQATLPSQREQVCNRISDRCTELSTLCVCTDQPGHPANFCTDFTNVCMAVFNTCVEESATCLERSDLTCGTI